MSLDCSTRSYIVRPTIRARLFIVGMIPACFYYATALVTLIPIEKHMHGSCGQFILTHIQRSCLRGTLLSSTKRAEKACLSRLFIQSKPEHFSNSQLLSLNEIYTDYLRRWQYASGVLERPLFLFYCQVTGRRIKSM